MDENSPVTWGQLRRIVEKAGRTAGAYSDTHEHHEALAQETAGISLAHLEAALGEEFESAKVQADLSDSR